MALSDIAAGLSTTTEQRQRGVATVDDATPLDERLSSHAEALPCDPDAATTVVESYVDGTSVEDASVAAGVAPVTAAKTLHRLGVEGLSPLSPRGREILRDWLDAELPRADALALTGASEAEFALAAFVETHDPIEELVGVVDDARTEGGNAAVDKRDALAGTMDDATDYF